MKYEQHIQAIKIVSEIESLQRYVSAPLPTQVKVDTPGYYYALDQDPQIKAIAHECKLYLDEAILMYLQSRIDSLNDELEKI